MAHKKAKLDKEIFASFCFNPFNKKNHVSSDTRRLSDGLISKFPTLSKRMRICGSCRKELSKLKELPTSKSNEPCEDVIPDRDHIESEKDDRISDDDGSNFTEENMTSRDECQNQYHKDAVKVLEQIKEKYKTSTSRAEKIQLLTLAPPTWSRAKTMAEFGTSERKARIAKKLVAEHGILTLPNTKKGKPLECKTEALVTQFYQRDDMSRLMPGMKDWVSVRIDGKKVQMQKRIILCNLNELFASFQSEHEDIKIGFTKFTQLRPKHCVLAGSSGTHTVCVCIYHENVKLMLKEINLNYLTNDSPEDLNSYRDCLKLTMCPNVSTSCHLGECSNCPGTTFIKENLVKSFDREFVEEVKFESWLQSERCTLKTVILSVDDFVEEICTGLVNLRTHDFLVKEQRSFFENLKIHLQAGEFVISYDFAENYKYVIQDAIQAFHFNNDQATIFTIVIYYMKDGKLEHKSMAIISDDLKHDAVAVYEYQKIILNYLKSEFTVAKVYYVSDGARQHFKNKSSFANLMAHETDFDTPAEWHFHPTAHGKGACDGQRSTVKKLK
ncbi:PREDICTED: uncharacterized protein LOC108378244 [Rhagoletis zephyria]|uniref:uncharacterized protein LOC108361772 n=2 Tax=Rhagoletis zephyria TaxID=28612 RepID=UPI0008119201|nr:PREDICTED: uncharacterized protein LOC108361772 [Rhagoletis zephyria]XP_017471158.1 PREDICTED: uncharacterized protein LOC108362614 [Rhagoletis zephyria]XP_017473543.1 PREDICTED: uncharacterized protein LOC108364380 [Rhagoletis zephyria]XP_017479386.1 PREDICTED: uncharacterized protein LOC108368929 [Rhagoletis zephyria]XP_017490024.1 PREDICTED: uncharacterized protein LOC108378244 [Rhagoletis zephyria]